MTASVLAIIATTLGFTAWWVQRKAAQRDAAQKPGPQNKERYEQIDSDIANRDSTAATIHANADLDELDRLRRSKGPGNSSGQN